MAKTITLDSFEALFAHECPKEAAKKAEAERKAEANQERQKEAQRVKKMFHDTYKALAEGAACLWRIAKTQHFTSYEQYENYLNKYKPAKMKQASKVLKELKLMGYDIIDEDCVECQLNYYFDSLESE